MRLQHFGQVPTEHPVAETALALNEKGLELALSHNPDWILLCICGNGNNVQKKREHHGRRRLDAVQESD